MDPDNSIHRSPANQTGAPPEKPEMADRDLIYHWVQVADFGGYLSSITQQGIKGIPEDCDTGIGYVYIDHTAGISLKIEYLCRNEPMKQGSPALFPLDDLVSLRFRYSTLELLDFTILTADETNCLGLPEAPRWARHYESADMKTIRGLVWLDPFRWHGQFDDVAAILPVKTDQGWERVSVRLEKYMPDFCIFFGILLQNIPGYGLYRNDRVEIVTEQSAERKYLVVTLKN